MVEVPGRVQQDRPDVVRLKVVVVGQDVGLAHAGSEQFEDINHPYAHATNTGASPALRGVEGNPVEQFHALILSACLRAATRLHQGRGELLGVA